jgi:hypothetical protein
MTPEKSKTSSVSRRGLLQGAAAVGLGSIAARGVYAVLEDFVTPPRAWAAATVARKQEQYLIDSLEVILDNNTPVVIPPVYNDVFTAKLAAGTTWNKTALVNAQKRLEAALAMVEKPYPSTAAGLTIVVAWGLPYFRNRVPGPWQAKGPRDLDPNLPLVGGQRQFAVLDAIRFPSDPATTVLESNEIAFKIRSDKQSIVQSVETQLFADPSSRAYVGDLFDLTSKRIGFAGRGFGTTSAAKTLALAAGVAGAASIPDRAQLMMGFTSTQPDALGPDNIVSFETLKGVTDQWPSGYFAHGCAMHLSHLNLDIVSWYGKSYADRVQRMFSPSTTVVPPGGTVTVPNGAAQVVTLQQVKDQAAQGLLGHNSALQPATRLGADVVDNYGRLRKKGSAVPEREDFNTLDDPFSWYVDGDGNVQQPPVNRPGLHFAVFVPTSNKFHIARKSMDGVMPDGTDLRTQYGLTDEKIGFNKEMEATHRQNYLVPPRAHRSFPLAELL